MKKLKITKEQFNTSKYFQKKYGTLKYVSESGKLFKTSKGNVLKFNESEEDDEAKFAEICQKYAAKMGEALNMIHDFKEELISSLGEGGAVYRLEDLENEFSDICNEIDEVCMQ